MFNREPTVIINGLAGLAIQILPLLVVVGFVEISPERLAGFISIIGLVATFIATTLLRSQVSPAQDVQTALDMPKGSSMKDLEKEIAKQN